MSSLQAQNQVPVILREYNVDGKYAKRETVLLRNSIIVINTPKQTHRKPLYLALKNNLLYDAALLPNLGAEVYLGNQLSLAIDGNWSWWRFDKQIKPDWFHRIQTADVELRYWIDSPCPLTGHAVGLYAMTGNYDVRVFTKNEFSKGWLSYGSWSAGLSYAYSIPVSCNFNMEFGLALGYVWGKYYQYDFCTEHEWWAQRSEKNRHYFGPTRAGVSLVWLIGNGNNRKKRDVLFIREARY